jgi:hypothetical protein
LTHYVLIQEPRREGVYVQCRDIDQCLLVVDDELKTNMAGTRVTMFRKDPRQTAELLAMWRVERGGPRRYRVNEEDAEAIVSGMPSDAEYRANAARVTLGRSGSNPGEISFSLPSMAAIERMGKVFADVTPDNLSRVYGGIGSRTGRLRRMDVVGGSPSPGHHAHGQASV